MEYVVVMVKLEVANAIYNIKYIILKEKVTIPTNEIINESPPKISMIESSPKKTKEAIYHVISFF